MEFELGVGATTLKTLQDMVSAKGKTSDTKITRLVTHSAEVREGDLFCALGGPKGGAKHAHEAIARGASAILSDVELSSALPTLLVADVPNSLSIWAKTALKGHRAHRIAVTGSVGKTGTKNALTALFESHFRTHKNIGNYNNLLGVSFTVLSMPQGTEILISEMGTNHTGEISALSRIVEPSDAIITAIGTAHLAAFKDRQGVAKEKLGILDGMSGGRLFYPYDEPLLRRLPSGAVTPVAVYPHEGYVADEAVARAVGFATHVASAYGIPKETIAAMLPTCATRATRRVFKPIGGILLIDDAYNASPESVRCALRFLSAQAIGRRVLLLGDMLELGKDSAFLHTEIGKEAAACADIVFFYGAYRDAYVQGAHKIKGGARIHPLHSQSEEDAAREMLPYLKAGDTVLFKSSNKGGAKKIFEHLRSLLS